MPYKGEQNVRFPQHETQNVMLLFGDNMRGKTSFLNAIRWGFYGKALGRHLREIPRINLVNIDSSTSGDWSMSITLLFSNQEKKYELKRTINIKQHVSQPKTDADFEESVYLAIDGEVQSGDIIGREVNQIIPEEISRFFLFDGELLQEYENLLIEDSEHGEKIKEHIEQALGVPALLNGRDDLQYLLKQAINKQAFDARKSKELKGHAERQKQLSIKRDTCEKDYKDLLSQKESIQSDIDAIDDNLRNTEAVQRKKVELEHLEGEKKSIEGQLIDLANDLRELLRNAWKDILNSSVSPMLKSLSDERNNIQASVSNKAILDAKIQELTNSLNEDTCPTCKQEVPVSNKEEITKDLEQFQAQAELSIVNIDDMGILNTKIDKLTKIKSSDEMQRIIKIVAKERKLQVSLIKIDTDLEAINDEIKGHDTDYIMRQRQKHDLLISQKARLNQDIEGCKSEIQSITENQDHIAKLISKSSDVEVQLSSIRVNKYQELTEIFSKGIDKLRDSLRVDVAEYASNAFKQLTTETAYTGLEINKSYGLSILDREGRVLSERSAGAEQIVALSLIDGLNKTARKSGPIVMDTPLGRLDPKHRSNVLKYLPNMADQVVLLVHEGEINPDNDLDNFASRIGARYEINRVSDTQSIIEKCD